MNENEVKEEKGFKYGIYAVSSFIVIALILTILTVTTFQSKYIAFHSDIIAENYVDSIVQKGDGYNANHYSLMSKNKKYGDYIREHYMYTLIYADSNYKPGDDTSDMKGLNEDSVKSDATKNDDGSLLGQVTTTMYDYYVSLINNVGWDNYDEFFTSYFAEFQKVRASVFGDEYLSDEDMFTSFEANVATYGDSLTGTEDVYDEDAKVYTSHKSTGLYETAYGDDYKITTTAKETTAVEDVATYVKALDAEKLEDYGIKAEDINAVDKVTVECTLADGTVIATQEVYEIQIGNSWYIDNLTTDTSALYSIAK